MRGVPSGCFGGGHGEGVVANAGDQVEPPAECLDVTGNGVDGDDLTALDLRYPPGRDAHRRGKLGLGKAMAPALHREPVPALPRKTNTANRADLSQKYRRLTTSTTTRTV